MVFICEFFSSVGPLFKKIADFQLGLKNSKGRLKVGMEEKIILDSDIEYTTLKADLKNLRELLHSTKERYNQIQDKMEKIRASKLSKTVYRD